MSGTAQVASLLSVRPLATWRLPCAAGSGPQLTLYIDRVIAGSVERSAHFASSPRAAPQCSGFKCSSAFLQLRTPSFGLAWRFHCRVPRSTTTRRCSRSTRWWKTWASVATHLSSLPRLWRGLLLAMSPWTRIQALRRRVISFMLRLFLSEPSVSGVLAFNRNNNETQLGIAAAAHAALMSPDCDPIAKPFLWNPLHFLQATARLRHALT